MKRVILVHGWDGGPDKDWLPWLAEELKNRGFEIIAPQLPDTEEPRKEQWVPALAAAVGAPDAETFFIAHSMGAQATLRYLETLPENVKVGGALFVAGFLKPLINLEGPKAEEIARAWTDTPFDLVKIRAHLSKSTLLLSDDDEWVTRDNGEAFADAFGSKVVIELGRQHFNESEEPAVLREALALVS